jgi:hypothetical protein
MKFLPEAAAALDDQFHYQYRQRLDLPIGLTLSSLLLLPKIDFVRMVEQLSKKSKSQTLRVNC